MALHVDADMFMRARLVTWLAVALPGAALHAEQGGTRLHLDTSAAGEPCPAAVHVQDGVTRRLGRDPWNPQGDRHVTVTVKQVGDALHARVDMVDASGQRPAPRELTAPRGRCTELLDAVALSTSIAMDPLSVFRAPAHSTVVEQPAEPAPPAPAEFPPAPPPPPGPPPSTASTPVPAPRVETPPRAHVATRSRRKAGDLPGWVRLLRGTPRVGLSSSATFNAAMAPHGVVGGVVGAHAFVNMLGVVAEVRTELPGRTARNGVEVSSRVTGAGAGPCVAWRWLQGCVLGHLGVRHVMGSGDALVSVTSVDVPWLAVGPRAGVAVPLGMRHLEMILQLDAWVVPLLARLRTTGGAVLWTQPPVTGVATAGLRAWAPW